VSADDIELQEMSEGDVLEYMRDASTSKLRHLLRLHLGVVVKSVAMADIDGS
jgi:hypothetical protein